MVYVCALCFRDIECSTDTSLRGFPGYFSTGKQTGVNKQNQEEALNELNQNSRLRLELGGNYPYSSYALNLLSEKKFKSGAEVNMQEGPVDYQVNSFEPPRPDYDVNIQTWASTSGSCGVGMFDDQSYPQVSSFHSPSIFFYFIYLLYAYKFLYSSKEINAISVEIFSYNTKSTPKSFIP